MDGRLVSAAIGSLAVLYCSAVFAALPENLAAKARIEASGQYSSQYAAKFTADGRIPRPQSHNDVGQAWCIPQAQAAGATLRYEWAEPVSIAEVVYYGRTAFRWDENFREVEIYVGSAQQPLVVAKLRAGHGPQRIKLPRVVKTKSLLLKFTKADPGPNPGASEICIFASPPEQGQLGQFMTPDEYVPFDFSPELAERVRQGSLGFRSLLVIERHPLRPSHVYTYHNEGFQPGGGIYRWDVDGTLTKLFDAGQGQLLDLEVSYDGKEVLFSWRRSKEETYQIYCMNVDGTNLRRLTEGDYHNFNPCWLPDGGIAFLSTRTSAYAYCWNSPVAVLYRMNRDGTGQVRLSANYLNDFTPKVLDDGRIIYARWEYVDRPAIPIQSLWTIHPDGTGLQVFYGNRVLSPATFMEARSIPGTDKILCLLTAHNGPPRGGVGIIDRRFGVNAQEAIINLTPEVNIGRVDQGNGNHVRGPYENPYPLDDKYFVVSYNGSILLRNYAGTEQVILLRRRGQMGFYNPQPIRPRPVPPVIKGRWCNTEQAATQEIAMATVFVQDVYKGLEPYVKRGDIIAIRVVEEIAKPVKIDPNRRVFGFQFPVVSCGATYAPKRVWGEVPVEPDGSAAFEVPAGRPIYFMVLDRYGRALQRMRSFTQFEPGEVQTCVGCHEPRNTAPVPALSAMALRKQPQKLRPPEWGVIGFSYRRIVQPVWDRHCVRCHNAYTPSGGVDLSGDGTDFFNVSYEYLARMGTPAENPNLGGARQEDFRNPYTRWISTYNGSESNILEIRPLAWGSPASPLADLMLQGHPDDAGKPRVELSDWEMRRVFAWIDLNVPYYGTSASNHPERQGCRRMWPEDFDRVFEDVARRRCISCHKADAQGRPAVPRKWFLRIEEPEKNNFMLAPLARSAGGTEACGVAVFKAKDDPDYQKLLQVFDPIKKLLAEVPRLDYYGSCPTCPSECQKCQLHLSGLEN